MRSSKDRAERRESSLLSRPTKIFFIKVYTFLLQVARHLCTLDIQGKPEVVGYLSKSGRGFESRPVSSGAGSSVVEQLWRKPFPTAKFACSKSLVSAGCGWLSTANRETGVRFTPCPPIYGQVA